MSIENAPQIPPNDGEQGYGVAAESAKLLHFVAATSTDQKPQPKVVPLDTIEAYLRSYLSFSNDQPFLPLALFVLLQHCWGECFDEVPYLLISAATQGSGKTRVLELLLFLAGAEKAILLDGDITRAALYTEIETMARVILIDEAEKLQSPSSPFRPILNSGYRRGATVLRKNGGKNEEFSIFCPKAMAQIGDVYSSLRDRCITIEMRRMQEGGQRKEFVHQVSKEEGRAIVKELEDTLPMKTTEKQIPTYVLEDRLFQLRLHHNLNEELERLHHLLTEQVRLLKEREALMSTAHAAAEQRWKDEQAAASNINSIPLTKEVSDAN